MPLRALLLLALVGCDGSPCGESDALVTRVIDGDTIELSTGIKIRYLLVDTPEISGSTPDCYGPNAAQFNTDLVLNKMVQLSYDVQCTDMYGRTLAYVFVDGREVNTEIILRGYGCVLQIPPNGESRVEEFRSLQLDAKNAMRGLWGACSPLPPACT